MIRKYIDIRSGKIIAFEEVNDNAQHPSFYLFSDEEMKYLTTEIVYK